MKNTFGFHYTHEFSKKDWDEFRTDNSFGVTIDTVSDGQITFTFDEVKDEITVKGISIDLQYNWDFMI